MIRRLRLPMRLEMAQAKEAGAGAGVISIRLSKDFLKHFHRPAINGMCTTGWIG